MYTHTESAHMYVELTCATTGLRTSKTARQTRKKPPHPPTHSREDFPQRDPPSARGPAAKSPQTHNREPVMARHARGVAEVARRNWPRARGCDFRSTEQRRNNHPVAFDCPMATTTLFVHDVATTRSLCLSRQAAASGCAAEDVRLTIQGSSWRRISVGVKRPFGGSGRGRSSGSTGERGGGGGGGGGGRREGGG